MANNKHIDIGDISIDIVVVSRLIESFDTVLKTQGLGPGLHYHTKMDEILYIQSGEVMVTVGDEQIIATPGTVVQVPKMTPHAFKSHEGPATLLVSYVPGANQVMYLTELEELHNTGSTWREGIDQLEKHYDNHPVD